MNNLRVEAPRKTDNAAGPGPSSTARRSVLALGLGGACMAGVWLPPASAAATPATRMPGAAQDWRLHAALGRPRSGGGAIAFAPDSRCLAVAGGNQVQLHDLVSMREIRRVAGRESEIRGLIFASEGTRLVAHTLDPAFDILQLEEGTTRSTGLPAFPVRMVAAHDGALLAVILERLSPAGRMQRDVALFAAGDRPREIARIGERARGAVDLAVSPDGARLAIACDDGRIAIAELRPAGSMREFGTPGAFRGGWPSAKTVSFSASGQALALGYTDGAVRLLDLSTAKLTDLVQHARPIERVVFAGDRRVFAADQDGGLLAYDAGRPGSRPIRIELPPGLVDLKLAPDGRLLASLLARGEVHLHDTATLRTRQVLRDQSTYAARVAISGDGRYLAVVASDGDESHALWLWDLHRPKEPLPVVRRHGDGRSAALGVVAFAPDGQTLALTSGLRCIHLVEAASGRDLRRLVRNGPDGSGAVSPWDVCFTPEGHLLAGYADGVAVLWDGSSGIEIARFGSPGTDHAAALVAASADGLVAVVSGQHDDRIGTVFSIASGEAIGTFATDAISPGTCAFLRSGIVGPRRDRKGDILELWSLAGEKVDTLLRAPVPISSVAALAGTDRVVVGIQDGTMPVLERDAGRHNLRGHTAAVLGLALSSDARTIASASADGTARIWCGTTGRQLLALMMSRTGQWLALAADGHFWASAEAEDLLALVRGKEARAVSAEFKSAQFRHRSPDDVRRALGLNG